MSIKQEIAELKAKLAELESKVNEPLDCYFGKGHWIKDDGTVSSNTLKSTNSTDYASIKNKEIAEVVAPLVQIQRALINFKCEHDPVFDFDNIDYAWTCNSIQESSEVRTLFATLILDSIPFSTKELAQSALDMLKRRKLI